MKIIKCGKNGEIRNNYICLSRNLVDEMGLFSKELSIIKLTNTRNGKVIYSSWKGGVIEKDNSCEFNDLFCLRNKLNEEYFYIDVIKDYQELNVLNLIPLTKSQYEIIENRSDFFEENFLKQVEFVFQGEVIIFFIGKEICLLKVEIGQEFGLVSKECEINVRYVNNEEEIIAEFQSSYSMMKIWKFQKKRDEVFNYTDGLLQIEASIQDKKDNKCLWIGEVNVSLEEGLVLPYYIVMNFPFMVGDKVKVKRVSCKDVQEVEEICEIEYFFENDNSKEIFVKFLKELSPFVITKGVIYKIKNFYFMFKQSENNRPILWDERIDIESFRFKFSKEIYIKFSYTQIEKANRYLCLPYKYYEKFTKEEKKEYKENVFLSCASLIEYIKRYFNGREFINCVVLKVKEENVYIYLSSIYKKAVLQNDKLYYIYLNLNILSKLKGVQEEESIKKSIKEIKKKITNEEENKTILFIENIQKYAENKIVVRALNKLLKQAKQKKNFLVIIVKCFSKQFDFISNNSIIPVFEIKETKKEATQRIMTSSFSSICGMEKIKMTIKEIFTLKASYGQYFPKTPLPIKQTRGILLVGPSGCGKTLIANSLKDEFDMKFFSVNSSDILSKYIGESENNIRRIFSKARESQPCIVFFDEFDTLVPIRGTGSSAVNDRIVNQLLTYLDGVDERKEIFIISACQDPSRVDQAMLRPGRIDKIIWCNYPDETERKEALEFFIKKLGDPEYSVKDLNLENLIKKMESFSFADIEGVIYDSYLKMVRKCIKEGVDKKKEILLSDIEEVIQLYSNKKRKTNSRNSLLEKNRINELKNNVIKNEYNKVTFK